MCSKVQGQFERGDGMSQGSCKSNVHKCQSSGICVECIHDSQCTGLSNRCSDNVCVCGESSEPCNSTLSNVCMNGVCNCGNNPQCSQTLKDLVRIAFGVGGCNDKKCSYDIKDPSCKIQRGPEVCENITKYYNPLYTGQAHADNACDDNKGKYLGTYQCLGITVNIFPL